MIKKDTVNILTHCNAGWLAINWGLQPLQSIMHTKKEFPFMCGPMKLDQEIKELTLHLMN